MKELILTIFAVLLQGSLNFLFTDLSTVKLLRSTDRDELRSNHFKLLQHKVVLVLK